MDEQWTILAVEVAGRSPGVSTMMEDPVLKYVISLMEYKHLPCFSDLLKLICLFFLQCILKLYSVHVLDRMVMRCGCLHGVCE